MRRFILIVTVLVLATALFPHPAAAIVCPSFGEPCTPPPGYTVYLPFVYGSGLTTFPGSGSP